MQTLLGNGRDQPPDGLAQAPHQYLLTKRIPLRRRLTCEIISAAMTFSFASPIACTALWLVARESQLGRRIIASVSRSS